MKKILSISIALSVLASCTKEVQNTPAADTPDAAVIASDTITTSTANFKGVNWADPRDNFVDDWLMLSGLSVTDDEATVLNKTETILSGFQAQGANTLRLPVNPATVLQGWWPRYAAIINRVATKGMKVILAYWEGSSSKNGKMDDSTAYRLMWNRLTTKYFNNGNVYFEVFNEPYGYSLTDLKTLYAQWLSYYPQVPKRRILLDGGGYATDVNGIGDDARFSGCLLSFHYYTWFNGNYRTTADWEMPVQQLKYPERTITTEFGCVMTDKRDFVSAPGSDNEVTYMQGMTTQLNNRKVGSVYWPGLRTGDSYSMFSYNNNTLSVNNDAGLTRLKYAWGTGTVNPMYATIASGTNLKIINRNSSKSVDVNGGSTSNGTGIIQWEYNGGTNQQWTVNALGNGYYSILNRKSGKALDVNGGSTSPGGGIIQWDYNGGNNQQWQITNIGFGYYKIINRNSGHSLDVNSGATWNGANIIQWNWNNGTNQQWQMVAP